MRQNQRFLLLSTFFICTVFISKAQNIESFLRPYADAIVKETAFEFRDKETNENFSSTNNLPIKQNLVIGSDYLHWRYTNALIYEGLFEFGKVLNEESYINYGDRAFSFIFDSKNYYKNVKEKGHTIEGLENFMRFKGVWNDGAQVAALIKVSKKTHSVDYLDYMNQVAAYFFNYDSNEAKRSSTKKRNKNIDQIYVKGVFMARMGQLIGEKKYFDYCVKEVQETDSLFYDPMTSLYNQYFYPHLNTTNNIKWLRGSGWAAMGLVKILSCLPKDHPGYEKTLQVYHKIITGIAAYQTKSGLWRHLVNRESSFEETSGSTYIVYAVAKGINEGFLGSEYRDVAMAGWQGIISMQGADGKIRNVTSGVSGSTSPTYYHNNSIEESDAHLYGPLFLAGAEMIKLYKKYKKPVPRNWKYKINE